MPAPKDDFHPSWFPYEPKNPAKTCGLAFGIIGLLGAIIITIYWIDNSSKFDSSKLAQDAATYLPGVAFTNINSLYWWQIFTYLASISAIVGYIFPHGGYVTLFLVFANLSVVGFAATFYYGAACVVEGGLLGAKVSTSNFAEYTAVEAPYVTATAAIMSVNFLFNSLLTITLAIAACCLGCCPHCICCLEEPLPLPTTSINK